MQVTMNADQVRASPAAEAIRQATAGTEDPAPYVVGLVAPAEWDDETVIAQALSILAGRLRTPGEALHASSDVKNFCRMHLGGLDHEVFGCLFLDNCNRLIEYRAMFRGTLSQTSVYPREVVKEALELHAAGAIFTHNHPSGAVQPSRADEVLTQTLKAALALVDVRVLDHIIVGASDTLSMAEVGLL